MNDKEAKDKVTLVVGIVIMVFVYIVAAFLYHNSKGPINPEWEFWNKKYSRISERYNKVSIKYGTKARTDDFYKKKLKKLWDQQPPRRLPPPFWKTITYPIAPAYMLFLLITKGIRQFAFGAKNEEDKE